MHSTSLTPTIRRLFQDRPFGAPGAMNPDLAAEMALGALIPRLRTRERLCPICHLVIRAAATTCDECPTTTAHPKEA